VKPLLPVLLILAIAFSAGKKSDQIYRDILLAPKKGFKAAGGVRTFDRKTLYDEIDGGAEVYLDYHFKKLAKTAFRSLRNGGQDTLIVELYDMRDPLSAYGVFAKHRDSEAGGVQAGRGGVFQGNTLAFWQDRYYVRIFSYQTVPKEAVLGLARGLTSKMGRGPGAFPALEAFKGKNLVPHTRQYHPANYFGQKALADFYSAEFTEGGVRYTLFYKKARDVKAARTVFGAFIRLGERGESLKEQWKNPDGAGAVIADEFEGRIQVLRKGSVVAGAHGGLDKQRATRILSAFIKKNL
jgi:hypothetical protein